MSTRGMDFDQSGKALTSHGTMDEPMTGEYGKYVRHGTRILSKNKHVFNIHDLSVCEPNTMVIEVTYTRVK